MLLFGTKTVRLNLGLPGISSSSWLTVPIHDVPACRSLAGQHLTNGEIFSGEVVVAAWSDSLKQSKPPTAVRWLRALGDHGESASLPQTARKSLVTRFCRAATPA